MVIRNLRSTAAVLALLGLLTDHAQAEPKDASAQREIGQGVRGSLAAGDHAAAEAHLRGVDAACGAQCSAAVRASAWHYIGIARTRAGNAAGATAAFRVALRFDPNSEPNAGYATEAVRASYAEARGLENLPPEPNRTARIVLTPAPAPAEPAAVPPPVATTPPAPPLAVAPATAYSAAEAPAANPQPATAATAPTPGSVAPPPDPRPPGTYALSFRAAKDRAANATVQLKTKTVKGQPCQIPCTLYAPPGKHLVLIRRAGKGATKVKVKSSDLAYVIKPASVGWGVTGLVMMGVFGAGAVANTAAGEDAWAGISLSFMAVGSAVFLSSAARAKKDKSPPATALAAPLPPRAGRPRVQWAAGRDGGFVGLSVVF